MNHPEPDPVTFSARFPADTAEELKILSRRHGPRSGVITTALVEGARMWLATKKRTATEDAGASRALEMA